MARGCQGRLCLIASLLSCIGMTNAAFAGVSYSARIFEGDPVPGTEAGTVFSWFRSPAFGADDEIFVFAGIAGDSVDESNRYCIVRDGPNGIALVARSGNVVPGAGGDLAFGELLDPVYTSGAGHVAFRCYLTGSGVSENNDTAIVSGLPGTLSIVAREGDPAPGAGPGVYFGDLSDVAINLNAVGRCAFLCELTGLGVDTSNNHANFSEGDGLLGMVIREGMIAPGAGIGETISDLGDPPVSQPRLSNDGHVTFPATLAGGNVSTDNNKCIYNNRAGFLDMVARTGEEVPGTTEGVVFASIAPPSIDATGRILLSASLEGTGVTPLTERALCTDGSGSLSVVVRGGEAAPGLGMDVNHWAFGIPTANASGQIAFKGVLMGAGVESTNSDCIFSEGMGTITPLAREGDQADGLPADLLFGNFQGSPLLTDNGFTLFWGNVTGPDVVPNVNSGCIWLSNPLGQTTLLGRHQDQVDIDANPDNEDIRTIYFIFFSFDGAYDGRPSCIDASGRFVSTIWFTDGSMGVFIVSGNSESQCACAGDLNADGRVDGRDIQNFTRCLIEGSGGDCACADVNDDHSLNAMDVQVFGDVLLVSGGCD